MGREFDFFPLLSAGPSAAQNINELGLELSELSLAFTK